MIVLSLAGDLLPTLAASDAEQTPPLSDPLACVVRHDLHAERREARLLSIEPGEVSFEQEERGFLHEVVRVGGLEAETLGTDAEQALNLDARFLSSHDAPPFCRTGIASVKGMGRVSQPNSKRVQLGQACGLPRI